MEARGAYSADRASALSGVPKSTIHWWARESILVPSVSPEKVKLWSYADLIALRIIYWLRQRKTTELGVDIPATSMSVVRRALAELRALDMPLWHDDRPTLLVNGDGHVYLQGPHGIQTVEGQLAHGDVLDLVAPFTTGEGLRGPNLLQPRPELRIIPGKLSGSPHVVGTRVETRALAALMHDGFDEPGIVELYPFLTKSQVEQAIDLEQQLAQNLLKSAA
jgi:uncharacterized protein (DUF433 family)/DNA-binding transcriptional MerR regulator